MRARALTVVAFVLPGLFVAALAALGAAFSAANAQSDRPSAGQIIRLLQAAANRAATESLGLPAIEHPADNLPTAAKVALGRKLFFDRRLSFNDTMSCAMCHVPEQAFANNELALAIGMNGASGRRNAPTLINVGYYRRLFVDGRERGLESQFFSPLLAKHEMANSSVGAVLDKIESLTDYAGQFEAVFGAPVSADSVGKALAAYQRTLIAAGSPFDQWRFAGKEDALSQAQKRGFALFAGRAGCVQCHQIQDTYATFTDQQFHDTGHGWQREQHRQHPPASERVQVAPGVFHDVPTGIIDSVADKSLPDLGRYEATHQPVDLWKYRTPSLRNVALTAPYMHDGGLSSLLEVVEHYDRGGVAHPALSPKIRPLGLSKAQKSDLIEFMQSLTSPDIDTLVREARLAPPDNFRRN